MGEETALKLTDVTKCYPGVIALDHISLEFKQGEVHALVGENGAGKSTLIKMISGAEEPTEGTVQIDGQTFTKMSPRLSKQHGIAVIYQEFNLVGGLTVSENISLGEVKEKFVNYKELRQNAVNVFREMEVSVDPDALVRTLPTAQQQLVEIAKAISKNARLIVMDEPTAPLTMTEVNSLFHIIRKLKANGVTVIYISHRMEEIFEISDRVTVMRDGCFIGTKLTKETDRQELIHMMVGREVKECYPERHCNSDQKVLELKDVCGNGDKNISFNLKKGEIVGLAGLVGAGRTELARVIFGADKLDSGTIEINGEKVRINSPKQAIRHGIGLIPEDRKQQGCFLSQGIDWNISISNIKQISKHSVVNNRLVLRQAEDYQKKFQIKTPSISQLVIHLSGGNQQKVVVAKTLATNSNIIIFDEPTRGIDVIAKQEIYNLMNDLAESGKSIIMISSDMEELIGMSDRIFVLCNGRITAEMSREEFDRDRILDYASGE